ncbi:alkaline phosphatase PhoX [Haladaptatus halobius]|uniref:alkaline phosphatase PhoX n=1 Tax=Haladaptatus halobius TaxID=2884875 RepID=UPI0034A2AC55
MQLCCFSFGQQDRVLCPESHLFRKRSKNELPKQILARRPENIGGENVNFRDVEGTWNNCFGTVTPWNTPLTSEEYEPDAAQWYTEGTVRESECRNTSAVPRILSIRSHH